MAKNEMEQVIFLVIQYQKIIDLFEKGRKTQKP